MRFVVTYDISSDASRKLVAELLEAVLVRVQYSVFEGEVPETLLDETVREALPWIDAKTDSIRVYRLCAWCAARVDVYGRTVDLQTDPVRVL